MSDNFGNNNATTEETVLGEVERLATSNSKGNLDIVENEKVGEALNIDIIPEPDNKNEIKISKAIHENTPESTDQKLNENVIIESPETESYSESEAMGGSEEMLSKPCQPCLENNKEIDSLLYCIECEEYLCEKCVEMHRGVKLSKNHKLVPKETPDEDGMGFKINKREECPIHLNEFIEWFCILDDKLCCPICKATEHGRCQSLVAITSAAQTTEIQTIEQEITVTQTKLLSAIEKKRTDITFLEEDRNDSLRVLENIKTDTENTFQNLRRSIDKESRKIEAKYMEQNKQLRTDMENYSKSFKNLDTTLAVLRKETICDEYKFIQMKKAEQHLKSVKQTILDIAPEPVSTPIGFERDKLYGRKLNAFNRFGYFDVEKHLYKCSKPKKVNILQSNEAETQIFDICVVGCGKILITDWVNNSVKLVDTDVCAVKFVLKMPRGPFGICKLEEANKYAVTLTYLKQVMFIRMFGKKVTRDETPAFDTGENCHGIACCNSRMFVLCGGTTSEHGGPGHIRIFDINGKLLETVIADTLGRAIFSGPCKIAKFPGKDIAFITDSESLIEINTSDSVIRKVHMPISSKLRLGSLCFDPEGRVLIAESSSKSIKLISRDFCRTELIVSDLPQWPFAIAMDNSNLELFVGLGKSEELLCFQMEKNKWDKAPTFG